MSVATNSPLWLGASWVASQKDVPWGDLEGKTVAITGATGLIGKTLALSIIAHNNQVGEKSRQTRVLALVRNVTKAQSILGDESSVDILHWDASNPTTEGFPKADYVVHCANMTDSASFIERPVEVIETTTAGARSMLEYGRQSNARVLVLSTMEVYGQYDSEDPISEDQGGFLDAMSVRNSYPEAKRLDEALSAAYASEFSVSATVARLAQTFGPGVSYDDRRVFADFARSCVEGRNITLLTTGQKRNMYLSTRDAATGLLTVLVKGEAGRAYNVANDDTICTIREMAEEVAARFGNGRIQVEVKVDAEAAKRFRKGDLLRLDTFAVRELGWAPKVGLMEMYNDMIEQWKTD